MKVRVTWESFDIDVVKHLTIKDNNGAMEATLDIPDNTSQAFRVLYDLFGCGIELWPPNKRRNTWTVEVKNNVVRHFKRKGEVNAQ